MKIRDKIEDIRIWYRYGGVSDAIDGVMEWWLNRSSLGFAVKTFGIIAAGSLAIVGFMEHVGNKNYHALKDVTSRLDNGASFVFASIEACSRRGMTPAQCQISKDAAMRWENTIGTSLAYGSGATCERIHGGCHYQSTMTPVIIGNSRYFTFSGYYEPGIVGWQAATNDLKLAVPLYASSRPGYGIRADNKLVSLSQN